MIEIPEAAVLANQISTIIRGKTIRNVIAAQNPHKFAWYFGDPQEYKDLLTNRTISKAVSYGRQIEIMAGSVRILLSDGVNLRYLRQGEKLPDKHQLLLEFDNGSFLVGSVQMYGGLSAFPKGKNDNGYYLIAKEKPSPLSDDFDKVYFYSILKDSTNKLSLKAFLATEQRIPGLGNGVLQDILFKAKMHPKKKVGTLSDTDKDALFNAIKTTLAEMVTGGGRDTESDLLSKPGGYRTILSKNTVNKPCPVCGTIIKKEAYMGGSIYYCQKCQRL